MRVCAIMRVRDEADVIEANVRHLLAQVDAVIVSDNASTDGTWEILNVIAGEEGHERIELLRDLDTAYYQSRAMTELAHHARECGFDWIVPIDADEVWYANGATLAERIAEFAEDSFDVVTADLFDHVATAHDPAGPFKITSVTGVIDVLNASPFERMLWRRRERTPLPKVACRLAPGLVIEQGNHGVRYPVNHARTLERGLVVRHFPYRSVEQFVHKVEVGAAAYAATDLPEHIGAHWRDYGRLLHAHGPAAIEEIFHTWFYSDDPASDPGLILDPAPLSRGAKVAV